MTQPRRRAVLCDASALPATLAVVDQLAHAQLAARSVDAQLELRNPSRELRELLRFVGLAGVLPVEVERQAEQREQGGGVEKEGQLGDPPA
jgi:hypothetical protein